MKISDLSRNACVDAVTALINAGGAGNLYLRTGSAPANTTDADSGTLLSTLPMSATSFAAASGGTATANTITTDSSVAATGTAAHFRLKSGGGAVILQGTVGTSASDIDLNTTSLVSGGTCAITSLTLTQPAS